MIKKLKWQLGIMVVVLVLVSGSTLAMTPEEIIQQVDDYQHLQSARMEAEMTIIQEGRQMTKELVSLVKGSQYGLTKFTNPRDRGSKFLKRDDSLWMYFPDAEDVVKISGHMLSQGLMGSDFSYQDMLESTKLTELYNFELLRKEKFQGRSCYVIEGIKQEGTEASYYRRVSWIDQQRFVPLKEELYARSGRLLKVMKTEKVDKIEGRWFPTHQVIDNKLKEGTRTEYKVNAIEFGVDIPDSKFSLRNLRR